MNKHRVSVSQLQSYRGAFLNVDEEEGHIGVWTSTYRRPTFLVFMKKDPYLIPYFIQFEDLPWAAEWFEHWKEYITKVFRVRDGELGEVDISTVQE